MGKKRSQSISEWSTGISTSAKASECSDAGDKSSVTQSYASDVKWDVCTHVYDVFCLCWLQLVFYGASCRRGDDN